jgi:hypothetical protein
MPNVKDYRQKLQALDDWLPFLLKNSGLPGPRGNLELAQAAAELASGSQVKAFLSIPPEAAPENSAEVFVVFCGITALGKMIARGKHGYFARLRSFAGDARWRVREAVAIALQYVGDADMQMLLEEMKDWSAGSWYEKRAAAAALAEPRLLKDAKAARAALKILDRITLDMAAAAGPREAAFKVLRQSIGYCWSVAVAALPEDGKAAMEKWLASSNADVRWVMKENLKKNRLVRMDRRWVERWMEKLQANP